VIGRHGAIESQACLSYFLDLYRRSEKNRRLSPLAAVGARRLGTFVPNVERTASYVRWQANGTRRRPVATARQAKASIRIMAESTKPSGAQRWFDLAART